ncbi:alanine racemase [Enterococcus sp. PF1-24]|uniref:alanine racemase n=1 Tax=unclassified Enterococcus TaxID=2608891 RepID=UPI00247525E9|nr:MULTISPECIES: alanine racemase [unclassified Enterococcus]MDH6364882.1 alanine racemase [Enterococcus sp. PFB1-1]MDH6401983.1 alanine racemase [Enterococcus sp. PF1-24]
MVTSYYRPTKAIIHKERITYNVASALQKLPAGTELFAAVKAEGYGHGEIATAQAAKKGGATGFCVATLDEGIALRRAGFSEPVLVLGIVEPEFVLVALEEKISLTVATNEWLQAAATVLADVETATELLLHIKVDSGMGRIGFAELPSLLTAVATIQNNTKMCWQGIFTHFATADSGDQAYWQQQVQLFSQWLQALPTLPRYVHTDNSAALLFHEDQLGNMVRYGVGMYGLNPAGGELTPSLDLQPALELVSKLVQVKKVPAGAFIGYGATYQSQQAEWIGTVPIGYADGWLRKMQGFSLLVEGEFCEIVGRVCMDQLMIRLPKAYPLGTTVTLIGENGTQEITMQQVAEHLDTIHYEVACLISSRIPREYTE